LSLSNLLCPWEWIEERARHIAQADLACVLYNVQSAGRQEGVYRILNLMLQSKAPHTLCGVVKNAYRPGQQVSIYRLDELPSLQFDMLTSIVIGNRFTRRKKGFIFTPRGYNDWASPAGQGAKPAAAALPQDAVWVFSGTGDGNALAKELASQGHTVVVSAATEYGGEVALKDCPGVTVWAGRQGVEARRQALVKSGARALVDATHPFASLMSEQLIDLSQELDIPYIRYERPGSAMPENAILCDSMEQAAEQAMARGQRIFLATGSKSLGSFLQAPGAKGRQWFARITAEPEFMQRAIDLGMPRSHICAMQGPFSESFNIALWRDWGIDCVVTKDSGDAGGFAAKAAASKSLGIPLLVVQRPVVAYPLASATFGGVIEHLAGWSRQ
jgi:precorrin-6x reductase